jgi:hypothetical protein
LCSFTSLPFSPISEVQNKMSCQQSAEFQMMLNVLSMDQSFLNSFITMIFLIWSREFCEGTGVKRADIVGGQKDPFAALESCKQAVTANWTWQMRLQSLCLQ